MNTIEIIDTRADELNLFYSQNPDLVELIVYGRAIKNKPTGTAYAQRLLESIERESNC